jgi:hypothetical protein
MKTKFAVGLIALSALGVAAPVASADFYMAKAKRSGSHATRSTTAMAPRAA